MTPEEYIFHLGNSQLAGSTGLQCNKNRLFYRFPHRT